MTDWPRTYVEWTDGDTAYISVPFTWDLPAVYQRAVWLRASGYKVRAGGPAVMLMPKYLSDVADTAGEVDALPRHNPDAVFTSRGCVRRCPFCAVWRIEGELRELEDWEPRPIVCDNNLLACSMAHFDRVIDRLKPLSGVDFNQGLDARLLTKHHADRLGELNCIVRLAWDWTPLESEFRKAVAMLRKGGTPKSRMRVYVIIGYKDTPEDALYRLQAVRGMGLMPNPMRYNPLDVLRRDNYVGENWTDDLLRQYMRYWANLRFTAAVPFNEWLERYGLAA